MTDDGIRMDPHYSADELEVITVRELKDRIPRLRTARAQQVAHELWRQADKVFTTSSPLPRRFLLDERSIAQVAGPLGRPLLLEMLMKLRNVRYERLLDHIGRSDSGRELPDQLRRMRGKGRHLNLDIAWYMHLQMESIMAGKPETPFHVQRNLVCALILVAVGFIAYSLRMWLLMQFHQATWTVPAMLLAVGIIYGVWYRLTYWVIAKMRVLALFMAFTDEFVEE
ncbi:hypothetical protein KDL44_13610 [bacterium]|nr:hypothetical protein [bacterium]